MARSAAVQYAVDKLRQSGASLFEPVVGANGVDLAVRGAEGQYVEIQVKEAGAGAPRQFAIGRFRPKGYVFFVCVVADERGGATEAWVLPSSIFERFASGAVGAERRVLDLDADGAEPLAERLQVYRERWALIAAYSKFRSTLSDPVALQMRLTMG